MICKECATPSKRLLNNPAMIDGLLQSCRERVSLGQSDMHQLADHLSGLNEAELQSVYYHSDCRKRIIDKTRIKRLRGNQSQTDSPVCSGRGRPSIKTEPTHKRPKRSISVPKENVCLFSSCHFCCKASEPIHRVFSDAMGEKLLEIKNQNLRSRPSGCWGCLCS